MLGNWLVLKRKRGDVILSLCNDPNHMSLCALRVGGWSWDMIYNMIGIHPPLYTLYPFLSLGDKNIEKNKCTDTYVGLEQLPS
jgi:hypothetical protein